MAFDFATTLLQHRGIKDEELSVLHVGAPEQKADQVPAQLQPDKLHADVDGKNIAMRLKIHWMEQAREPDKKAGPTLTEMSNTCAAPLRGCLLRAAVPTHTHTPTPWAAAGCRHTG